MNKKVYHFFIAVSLATSVFFVSCQKEFTLTEGIEPTTIDSNSQQPGICNTYMPINTGNSWSYEGSMVGPQTIKVGSTDSTINGKVFKRISITDQDDNFWRVENGNFYQFGKIVGFENILINPLREDLSAGDTWKDSVNVNGLLEVFEYQVKEKNISLKVNDFEFRDVIRVHHSITVVMPAPFPPVKSVEQDVWYAKCVGIVQNHVILYNLGAVLDEYTEKITAYTIK